MQRVYECDEILHAARMGAKQAEITDEQLQKSAGVTFPEGAKVTPMMRQWLEAKARSPNAILLFRMGDFYELFLTDAEQAGPVLDLVVTARDKDKGKKKIPMAGFPHHAAPAYIAKLIAAGHKVAVCDQLEDPAMARGIVKRGVTRIVTPGMVLDDESLDRGANNYLAVIACDEDQASTFGLAAFDLSTGHFIATSVSSREALASEVHRLAPKEIVFENENARAFLDESTRMQSVRKENLAFEKRMNKALKALGPLDPIFNEIAFASAKRAAAMVIEIVNDTQSKVAPHIAPPKPYAVGANLLLDETTRTHLELTGPSNALRSDKSLLGVIDKSKSALGARKILRWLRSPLADKSAIEKRLDACAFFKDDPDVRTRVREALAGLYDIERLSARLSSQRGGPQELDRLRASLKSAQEVHAICHAHQNELAKSFVADHASLALGDELDKALAEEVGPKLGEGSVFRKGYDRTLDKCTKLAKGGQDAILAMEEKEKKRTKIHTLKIKFTRVFGYYIEIKKTQLDKVPKDYVRKQTVANAERYVTDDLQKLEDDVNSAQLKAQKREALLFEKLRDQVCEHAQSLRALADDLATLDAHCALALTAATHNYVRPEILEKSESVLNIVNGRHAVVERALDKEGKGFVANSVKLDAKDRQVLLVTGPNMAGKSTLLRQIALIQILAQMGSFVPAESAKLSICDRIFTRVGASDDLAGGRSTFMVEMTETAQILKHATPQSLVLLDEIGRGTSTYDGLSIAWSVAEHLHDAVRARTLFATHYHELCELEESLDRLSNIHVVVKEWNDEIVFTRLVEAGAAERSYGVQVARLAGLPKAVLTRAREVLAGLEGDVVQVADPSRKVPQLRNKKKRPQMDLFSEGKKIESKESLSDKLAALDVNRMRPLEALNVLAKFVDDARETAAKAQDD